MNNTTYISPKQSAYCPECKIHPQQMRTRNHGERLCSAGHTFTLKQSREALTTITPPPDKQPAAETLERLRHEFVPGVKLWGQRLCHRCYKPFYYNIHNPSFGKSEGPSGKESNL